MESYETVLYEQFRNNGIFYCDIVKKDIKYLALSDKRSSSALYKDKAL